MRPLLGLLLAQQISALVAGLPPRLGGLATAAAATSPAAAPPAATGSAAPETRAAATRRKLRGKFLHITDIHPDPFYKVYSSTEHDAACHRGSGPAGVYGAETSGCDSPVSLMNATFKWIEDNIKDEIDFVVWTGDSARHDNDEEIPRTPKQIIQQNKLAVSKFRETFGKPKGDEDKDPTNDFIIPIVPTFGNNDIMPHNIFEPGPNKWTIDFLDVWRNFIPEAQRHQFQRGGWFFVEVIPKRLAVFSLNTMYFFDSNSAVDGCAAKSEPGFEHMEWLRIQLQIIRERGMKAILIGHVPPARTENKMSWDETCWQKYTLWMRQYRDVIVGSMFGHMNIDHFMLHDFNDIEKGYEKGIAEVEEVSDRKHGEISVASAKDYLLDLREKWSSLPSPPNSKSSSWPSSLTYKEYIMDLLSSLFKSKRSKRKENKAKAMKTFFGKIGGRYAERYSLSMVSASVVPNYFPTMRIIEYNLTGLEDALTFSDLSSSREQHLPVKQEEQPSSIHGSLRRRTNFDQHPLMADEYETLTFSEDNKNVKNKKIKKHRFHVPKAPSKSSPPGPAYSPQTLSLLGYTQLFANLTIINNDFTHKSIDSDSSGMVDGDVDNTRWKEGKHRGKKPSRGKSSKPHPKDFKYEVEYDTSNDTVYGMLDLTVREYFNLAQKMGTVSASTTGAEDDAQEASLDSDLDQESKKKKKGKKKKKKAKRRKRGKIWHAFVSRAFVGTIDPESIEDDFS